MALSHTLYLVRHGQTDWNKEGRFQGGIDIPLNDKGRQQAEVNGTLLAKLLADRAADSLAFYASPLSRAKETATLIESAGIKALQDMELDDRLRELTFGEWEGQTQEDLQETSAALFENRLSDPWGFRPPGGENYEDLQDRLTLFLQDLTSDSLVVCHGGVCRAFLVMLTGAEIKPLMKEPVPQDKVIFISNGNAAYLGA